MLFTDNAFELRGAMAPERPNCRMRCTKGLGGDRSANLNDFRKLVDVNIRIVSVSGYWSAPESQRTIFSANCRLSVPERVKPNR